MHFPFLFGLFFIPASVSINSKVFRQFILLGSHFHIMRAILGFIYPSQQDFGAIDFFRLADDILSNVLNVILFLKLCD